MKRTLRRFHDPQNGLIHHYSQTTPLFDRLMEERLAGYEIAARQHREGRRIGRPTEWLSHVLTLLAVFVAFAAIALTAVWVFTG